MSLSIHPTALVDPSAIIGENVSIGAFSTIGAQVVIGANTKLVSHVVIDGDTHIGKDCTIYPFATIGVAPQDLKYAGENSRVRIGNANAIREHVTIHRGTETGRMETTIGDNNLLMVGVHVAHDCIIGNNNVLANNATLAGHVELTDHVTIGGLSAVHQFVRIGAHSMIGGMTGVENDVVPYGLVTGNRAQLQGLNLVGLQRRGFTKDDITAIRSLYRDVFERSGLFKDRIANAVKTAPDNQAAQVLLTFITQDSKRGLCHPASN